jgi:hypothetical protein
MPPTSAPDPLQVSVGRRLVLTTLGLVVGLDLVTIGIFLVQSGGEGAATRVVRLLLTLLLSFWIWRGERWARWILVAYVALALMFIAPFLLTSDAYAPDRRAGTLVLLAFALLYLAIWAHVSLVGVRARVPSGAAHTICTPGYRSHGLTSHWSRRGGRLPYHGQSCALAAPQLSSGVIRLYAHWPDQVKVTPIE